MIVYAIKNEIGYYLHLDGNKSNIEKYCPNVLEASLFTKYVDAYRSIPYDTNCKVVKVEIREVEDDGGVK